VIVYLIPSVKDIFMRQPLTSESVHSSVQTQFGKSLLVSSTVYCQNLRDNVCTFIHPSKNVSWIITIFC